MRIIVNHLTRMTGDYVCVAGIDPHSGKHVRPALKGRLTRALLRPNGGPFDIAGLVDLGETTYEGAAPEVEDYAFLHWRAHHVGTITPDRFWAMLQAVARPTFSDIFGPELRHTGSKTCYMPLGRGLASLGCLTPALNLSLPDLIIDNFGKLRMRVVDSAATIVSVAVTDVRLFDPDRGSIRESVVADINRRLRQGVRTILSVGLTRPWLKPGMNEECHWLQINNIHLEDQPIWQIAEDAPGG